MVWNVRYATQKLISLKKITWYDEIVAYKRASTNLLVHVICFFIVYTNVPRK